MFRFT